MRFTKMHGTGNDYVYVDGFTETVPDPAALAVRVADRHFGIGSDGLILVLPPTDEAPKDAQGKLPGARMRMFNADGSEAEMCGNGIRCVCKLVHDHRLGGYDPTLPGANPMRLQTGHGTLTLHYTLDAHEKVAAVTVDMGPPILEPADIPLDLDHLTLTDQLHTFDLTVLGSIHRVTCVSMGNPHAVLYIEDEPENWHVLGRALETHPAFPRRVNVHFVRVNDSGAGADDVTVRHWERGSGPTLACGTGACAVAVAGVLTGRTARHLTAHLPGGPLQLEWKESNSHVLMTGPATEVFTGTWPGEA